jgi:integrase
LWITRGVGSLSVGSITTIATSVMRDAGVGESAHALRHTLAKRLLRERAADTAASSPAENSARGLPLR